MVKNKNGQNDPQILPTSQLYRPPSTRPNGIKSKKNDDARPSERR